MVANALVLRAFVLLAFAQTTGGQDIADFTGNQWLYVGEIRTPQSPESDCPSELEVLRPPVAPACMPDPFEDICRINGAAARDLYNELRGRADAFRLQIDRAFDSVREEVESRTGPLDRRLRDWNQYVRWSYAMEEAISEQVTASTRPQVEQTIARARSYMEQVVRDSTIPASQQETLIQFMRTCSAHPRLDIVNTDLSVEHNPVISRVATYNAEAYAHNYVFDYFQQPPVSALELRESSRESCNITLTPMTWQSCAEGRDECMFFVMHEFGHYLNSCAFLNMTINDEVFPEFWRTFDPRFERVSRRFEAISRTLSERTACLEETSDPHDFMYLNGTPRTPLTRRIQRMGLLGRCGTDVSAPLGYMSQWRESEADLWAASGFAYYLRSFEPGERRERFGRTAAFWCARRGPLVESHTILEQTLTRWVRRTRELEEEQREFERSLGITPSPSPTPQRIPGVEPWGDPHQPWPVRFNRIVLRNSDIRDVLGCDDRSRDFLTTVPMSCSPRGIVRRSLPVR